MKSIAILFSLLFAVAAAFPQALPDSLKQVALRSITEQDLEVYVEKLASPELLGRGDGSKGAIDAGNYISSLFQQYMLASPAFMGNRYQQPVPLNIIRTGVPTLKAGAKVFVDPTHLVLVSGHFQTIKKLEVVFIGYGGIEALARFDVKDKVVLIFVGNKSTSTDYDLYVELKKLKCRAILVINPDHPEYFQQVQSNVLNGFLTRKITLEGDAPKSKGSSIPEVYINSEVAETLLGKSIAELKEWDRLGKDGSSVAILPAVQASFTSTEVKEQIPAFNVVGLITGSELPDEVVVISGHYDHLGLVDGTIYPGADDNASGVSSVLEVAQAFSLLSAKGIRPKRSVAFVAFTGEESGLLGSKYFVANSPLGKAKVVVDINLDMVGRKEEDAPTSEYVYATTATEGAPLYSLVDSESRRERSVQLQVKNGNFEYFVGSDHYNFYKAGIPCVLLFKGIHKDYHTPSDTPEKLDYKILARI